MSQDCPIINENGDFEETIFVLGGEPSMGITTGQMANWFASHGTADYVTPNWNWNDLEGIESNAGHICYGNRETHDHSEGIFTNVLIHGDDDLIYTLSLDYSTVCDATNNGFLNIALNNNLNSEGHNWFQYPTPESFPAFFEEIQVLDRHELTEDALFENNGMSKLELSFVPISDFSQIWLFSEYQYEQQEFVNCGLILDNLEVTAMTSALKSINLADLGNNIYSLSPTFDRELSIVNYAWSLNHELITDERDFTHAFETGNYTICLDITDSRGACGSACREIIIDEIPINESASCTYSACLDLGGLPNILGLNYLAGNGEEIEIGENTPGFYFPYCIGTSNMCAGGENELVNFLEDLNAYFYNEGFETEATLGYSENSSDLVCRALAVTIVSSELVPISFLMEDFQLEVSQDFSINFDFNPDNCLRQTEDDIESYSLISNENIYEEDYQMTNKFENFQLDFNLQVVNNLIIINYRSNQDETDVNGEIFNLSGQKIRELSFQGQVYKTTIDDLSSGIYIFSLSQNGKRKNELFFIGE